MTGTTNSTAQTATAQTATAQTPEASNAAPLLNARVVGLAHYAPRALLEKVIAHHGVTFHQNLTLRRVATAGGSMERDELAADIADSLKVDASLVHDAVAELVTAKLLEAVTADDSRVQLTAVGQELHDRLVTEPAAIAARLYGGIPEPDLAVAGRVLTMITQRANAELAEA